MTRHILTALLTAALAVLAAPAVGADKEKAPRTVVHNEYVIVSGDFVRLGDIFTNAGKAADINVAYAPAPGKKATFDARWLHRVAKAYRLNWTPTSKFSQTSVQRDSLVVDREVIEDQILMALGDEGVSGDVEVEIANRSLRLHLPVESSGGVAVDDLDYNARTSRFSAIIEAPAGSPRAKRLRVSGRVHRITEIPALTRRLLAGEVISRHDLQWLRARSTRLRPDTVIHAADLIGKTPKRILRAGVPVRSSEVRRPILVSKRNLVTMVLQTPYMRLTARGKALEDGSNGDTIRITNIKSKAVVEAVVTGINRVAVRPAALALTSN